MSQEVFKISQQKLDVKAVVSEEIKNENKNLIRKDFLINQKVYQKIYFLIINECINE